DFVARPDDAAEAADLRADEIEDALVALHASEARRLIRAAAGAEQPLEYRPRIVLDRQRRRRVAPRNRVRVRTARPAVAGPEHGVRFDAELEGGELRLLFQLARGDLIHGDRTVHVRPGGELERHAGQERAG